MTRKKPTMLLILDGFGAGKNYEGNAIEIARKPFIDSLFNNYPHTEIGACGLDVGLPEGQMGNSEVGHTNIGAGRIVYQELTRITKSIEDGDLFENDLLKKSLSKITKTDSSLHIMGLLSDGGVHSHIDHLKALLKMARNENISNVYIHCLLDGRDVPPRCADKYINEIEAYAKNLTLGTIATIGGRYYGMDRDNRWDRVRKAYDAMVYGKGKKASTPSEGLKAAYERGEDDEFVLPTVIGNPPAIKDGDGIIMFNFRPDRGRQITRSFTEEDFKGFERKPLDLSFYITMTPYDASFNNVQSVFLPEDLHNTLGEYISKKGLRQLRIAETEKYAHVTFFFNGGRETPFKNEKRILVASPKVATYDLKPEMSAFEVKDEVLEVLKDFDLIILNFANADMVGHTGKLPAAVKAVEALDKCLSEIVPAVLDLDGQILLTADHGNADEMIDKQGKPVTSHSLAPVPLINIGRNPASLKSGGKLADLSPTLLHMMGLEKPEEMTGESLIATTDVD